MGNTFVVNTTVVQEIINEAPEQKRNKVVAPSYAIPKEAHNIIDKLVKSKTFEWMWSGSYKREQGAQNTAFLVFDGEKVFELTIKGASVAFEVPPEYSSDNDIRTYSPGDKYRTDSPDQIWEVVNCILTILYYTHDIQVTF